MYTVLIQNKFKRPLGEKNNLIPIPLNILKPCKVHRKIISSFETCDYIFLIIQRHYHLILRKLWLNVLASASLSKKMKKYCIAFRFEFDAL